MAIFHTKWYCSSKGSQPKSSFELFGDSSNTKSVDFGQGTTQVIKQMLEELMEWRILGHDSFVSFQMFFWNSFVITLQILWSLPKKDLYANTAVYYSKQDWCLQSRNWHQIANNVPSMLKRNCSSSSSRISEVFGKRIVDFLARNVADLKMHGTWALKVTKMAHFGGSEWNPQVETKSCTTFLGGTTFLGDGWTYGRYSVSIYIWSWWCSLDFGCSSPSISARILRKQTFNQFQHVQKLPSILN